MFPVKKTERTRVIHSGEEKTVGFDNSLPILEG